LENHLMLVNLKVAIIRETCAYVRRAGTVVYVCGVQTSNF
jgi:hypothetical protein